MFIFFYTLVNFIVIATFLYTIVNKGCVSNVFLSITLNNKWEMKSKFKKLVVIYWPFQDNSQQIKCK